MTDDEINEAFDFAVSAAQTEAHDEQARANRYHHGCGYRDKYLARRDHAQRIADVLREARKRLMDDAMRGGQ